MSEMFSRAFELAVFIHRDEEIATRIVVSAAAKLEVAASAQSKRLYYRPKSAGTSRNAGSIGLRRKIFLCDSHLLQRLVYIESEPYERAKEHEGAVLGQAEMARFFIKHLVRITLRRNSFYVALGVSRLLHSYNTAETMKIYNVVVQDPERVKDDYYYRSRKGVLMNELKDRFGDSLRTYRGPHGEERFQSGNHSREYVLLVKQCLAFFTPWATPCLIPDVFDPITSEIPRLVTRNPGDEDRTEPDRVHALTHPDCFDRLIRALGFESPEAKLALPHFFCKQNGQGGRPNSGEQVYPRLNEETLKAIEDEIADQALRRKGFTQGRLRVIVDGVEQLSLETNRATNSAEIAIGIDAELVELKASDDRGDLLLATHLIRPDDAGRRKPMNYRIVLEGGQEVSINVRYASPDDLADRILAITYRKKARVGAVWPSLRGRLSGLFDLPLPVRRRAVFSLIAITAMCIVLAVIGLMRFRTQRNRVETGRPDNAAGASARKPDAPAAPNQSKNGATPQDAAGSSTPDERAAVGNRKKTDKPGAQGNLPEVSARDRTRPQGTIDEGGAGQRRSETESTRDLTAGPAIVSLHQVRKIFLKPDANQSLNQELIAQLSDHLRASGRLLVVQSAEEADAVLKLDTQTGPTSKQDPKSLTVSALLVNANGDVVWPLRQGRKRAAYTGSPSEIAGRIAGDLLRDMRKAK